MFALRPSRLLLVTRAVGAAIVAVTRWKTDPAI